MARRSKVSRGFPTPIHSALTTPIHSNFTTPLSSAYPSAYPSEDESYLPIKPEKSASDPKGFRFLDLPPELRLRVYSYHFADSGGVIDREPGNAKRIHRKLQLFRVCRQIYHEAAPFFFGASTFRLFPIHYKNKKSLLTRLKPTQLAWVTTLELRLGPHFSAPPRSWSVTSALGLHQCVSVRKLKVFVQIDPSDNNVFKGWRREDGFYEEFSARLLADILAALPSLEVVEFDAYQGVKISGPMMQALLKVISPSQLLAWGPERGWNGVATGNETADSIAGIVGFQKLALVDYIPA